ERLLGVLGAKHDLALAALDADSDVDRVAMATGMDELKSRLEVLLGKKPDASREADSGKAAISARRERMEAAGGRLLSAAFDFLGEMLPAAGVKTATPSPSMSLPGEQIYASLMECVETGEDGRPRFSVTLPDHGALKKLAEALGRAMAP
ncbi:MAG: helicase, partial [Planctomycetota bacterium]|nr:helicase [Planctomycetota bacterium]